jgi:ABC-type microcin C transport system permease subunit YejE
MSHVRRKRPQHPRKRTTGTLAKKRENKRAWYSFALVMILFISVLAAVLIAVLTVQS